MSRHTDAVGILAYLSCLKTDMVDSRSTITNKKRLIVILHIVLHHALFNCFNIMDLTCELIYNLMAIEINTVQLIRHCHTTIYCRIMLIRAMSKPSARILSNGHNRQPFQCISSASKIQHMTVISPDRRLNALLAIYQHLAFFIGICGIRIAPLLACINVKADSRTCCSPIQEYAAHSSSFL